MPLKDPVDRAEYNEGYYNRYKDLIKKKNRRTMAAKPREVVLCKCGGQYTQIGKLKGPKQKHEDTPTHELWECIEKFIVPNRIVIKPELTRSDIIIIVDKIFSNQKANSPKKKLKAAQENARKIIKKMEEKGLEIINRDIL